MDSLLLEEALLVCQALGSTELVPEVNSAGELVSREQFVRGDQCLVWLTDLQR